MGTSTTLHARRLLGSRGIFEAVIRAGQREAAAPNLVGILAGDMGHGVDQFDVGHTDFPPEKRVGNGQGQKTPAARGADGETEKQGAKTAAA